MPFLLDQACVVAAGNGAEAPRCLCQRCIAREKQVYPSHCPHLELVSCDTSEGQCSDDCVDKTTIVEAECIENLWFCPENSQLVQLCEGELTDLDASVP